MNLIKRLTKTKDNPEKDEISKDETVVVELNTKTIYQNGYNDSENANGSAGVLETGLKDLYQKFKEDCRKNEDEQDRLKQPIRHELDRKKATKKGLEVNKSVKAKKNTTLESEIEKLKFEIVDVSKDPKKYGIESPRKPIAQFVIGLIILLPITLYLFVFYASASFSAFFKNFDSDNVIEAVFDASAINSAIEHGWPAAVFICTIPFAFMGLGYLIHMFQKQKGKLNFLKIIALFTVTFVFDSILAYQIEKELYDYKKTLQSPPFDFEIAISSVEFWGIIFAGFIVYIIWGLVFDFVMREYESLDEIKNFRRNHKGKINNLNVQLDKIKEELSLLENEIAKTEGEIENLLSKIDGWVFSNRKYLLFHAEYIKGWFAFIAGKLAISAEEKDKMIEKCKLIEQKHLECINVQDESKEGVIYTS